MSLKTNFPSVTKPQTELLWGRHWVLQNLFLFGRVPQTEKSWEPLV